jgi:hypothetical protein
VTHEQKMAVLKAKLDKIRGRNSQLRGDIAASQARTAEHKQALADLKGRGPSAREVNDAKVRKLKQKIAGVHAETRAIDRGLAREDRAADRGGGHGAIQTGARGGRFLLLPSGKRLYVKSEGGRLSFRKA